MGGGGRVQSLPSSGVSGWGDFPAGTARNLSFQRMQSRCDERGQESLPSSSGRGRAERTESLIPLG